MFRFDSPPRSRTRTVQLVLVATAFMVSVAVEARAEGVLENPGPDSRQSGIGVISGWKCTAGELSLSIDGGPSTKVAYGTGREDTRSVCGDADNGFSYLINWNLLGDGNHTVRLYDNGVLFAESSFDVVTFGTTFLRGASKTKHMVDFPEVDEGTTLQWQEGLQTFTISDWVPKGTALVRYQGTVFCIDHFGTSTLTTDDNSWTSIDGAITEYQRVPTDHLLIPRSYTDDLLCTDPRIFDAFSLKSGRRYTLSWRDAFLNLSNDDPETDPSNVPCFVAGTLVMTPDGEVPIESLRSGDLVSSPDGGWAVVTELRETPVGTSVPLVQLDPDSVAPGVPSRVTVVSPDHRIGLEPFDLHKSQEFCDAPNVLCETREVDFVYNLRLDGWRSTFIANGMVAEGFDTRDWPHPTQK